MVKKLTSLSALACLPFLLSACGAVGSKSSGTWIVYAVAAFLSLLLLIGYCLLVSERQIWFYLLFTSVLVVNTGYLLLAISKTLDFALFANRLAYLGSVFLPFAMLMIIKGACDIKRSRIVVACLLALSIGIFIIAASPGYSDIYYKSVSLETVNGMSVLEKEYGSWHGVYLLYLLGYFVTMFAVIIYSSVTKRLKQPSHAFILFFSVGINIGVWFLEQLVKIDFELLSISYILTELFLIGLYRIMQDFSLRGERTQLISQQSAGADDSLAERIAFFESQLPTLTPTEKNIYELYLAGKGTKDVLLELDIKENTLKFHNKNIYSKLGVTSRKVLLEIARNINADS